MVDAARTLAEFLFCCSLVVVYRSHGAAGTEAVVGFHRPNATASVWRVNPNKQGPDLNIGVIQVRLSNWTEKPTTTASPLPSREYLSTNIPRGQRNRNWKRKQQAGSVNVRRAQLTPYDASQEQDDDTSFHIGRFVDPDSAFAYTIVAISFGLVGILALVYGILTVLSNRSKKRMYLESSDLLYQHPRELERLYYQQHERRDMEYKRPPLYAPPPPPPNVPPPVPPSMPPPPAPPPPPPPYVRRKMQNNNDAQAEREFRLQLLKRQISESTTSRSRTGSI